MNYVELPLTAGPRRLGQSKHELITIRMCFLCNIYICLPEHLELNTFNDLHHREQCTDRTILFSQFHVKNYGNSNAKNYMLHKLYEKLKQSRV